MIKPRQECSTDGSANVDVAPCQDKGDKDVDPDDALIYGWRPDGDE